MITKTIIRKVTNGTAPYSYILIDESGQSCITIDPSSGTTSSGTVTATITATNSTCLANADIKLYIVDKEGCKATHDVVIEDPCDEFGVDGISLKPPFTFTVLPSGGSGSYSYEWFYDTSVFNVTETINPNGSNVPAIQLNYDKDNGVPPRTTPISVTITDSINGCEQTLTYDYNFCNPIVSDQIVTLTCDTTTGIQGNKNVFLKVQSCPGIDIDWTTLSFVTPVGMYVTHPWASDSSNPETYIQITTDANFPAGIYSINFTVNDEYGQLSNTGTLTVTASTCQEPQMVTLTNAVEERECADSAGTDITIDMTALAYPTTNIDWSTFEFVPAGTTTITTAGGTTGGYPNNAVFDSASKLVTYTIPLTSGTDSFQWQVQTTTGNYSNVANVTLWLDCSTPPTAVDDSDCAECGQAVIINVLGNDTISGSATIDPSTCVITTPPSNGSAYFDSSGNLVYTPNANYSGTDTIGYKVGNNRVPVAMSNEATVTIDVICAGLATNVASCP